jgi:hypothetical protein
MDADVVSGSVERESFSSKLSRTKGDQMEEEHFHRRTSPLSNWLFPRSGRGRRR